MPNNKPHLENTNTESASSADSSNNKNTSSFDAFIEHCQTLANHAMELRVKQSQGPAQRLNEALHYSTFNGGKRFRPTLAYATAAALGHPLETVDHVACSVEFIHAYSLVHDDLPAMDDDDLRRGKLTCHKAFDEATAILVGDSLHTMAFHCLTEPHDKINAEQQVKMIKTLAINSGPLGLAGGQSLDLSAEGKQLSIEELNQIHRLKTGALISATVMMSATACGCSDNQTLQALEKYAADLGVAFQVQDDILDVISDTETLGKQQGADIALNKATYPAILGLEEAQTRAQNYYLSSIAALSIFDKSADQLRALAHFVISRKH